MFTQSSQNFLSNMLITNQLGSIFIQKTYIHVKVFLSLHPHPNLTTMCQQYARY